MLPSAHSARETIDPLEAEVKAEGMAVLTRIDRVARAKKVGLAHGAICWRFC